ncbi:MAG: hypothetical protein LBS69_05785 [Prevotellaceae bacterium]|nr:hypothetical protein [Prevotellaceae bacterium]
MFLKKNKGFTDKFILYNMLLIIQPYDAFFIQATTNFALSELRVFCSAQCKRNLFKAPTIYGKRIYGKIILKILSIMEKKFEITKFETLESSNEMVKGGFSTAYAGGGGVWPDIEINFAAGCHCTNTGCNSVAGCACKSTATTAS